jgi:arachidonate 15-lipoxygenase
MTSSLSHHSTLSPDPNNLNSTIQNYQYNYTHIPPIAMVDQLPTAEKFPAAWYRLLARQLKVLFINTLIMNRGNRGAETLRDDVRKFILEVLFQEAISIQISLIVRILKILPQFLIKGLSKDFNEIDDLLFSLFRDMGLSLFKDFLGRAIGHLNQDQPTGHVTRLEDYDKLFPVIEKPAIANTFQDDQMFAYLQVAGYNPLMIERVTKLSDHECLCNRFPVTDNHYQAVMGTQDSLAAAVAEGRLYLADYGILDGAVNGTFPRDPKYLYAPLALFAVPPGSDSCRLLRPVAIQCQQTPGTDNPIFTPHSPRYAWLLAKAIVQMADANFHEPISHLARTHLFVGAFVITTHRQLPANHPLSLLLCPHFEGTLAINDAAQRILIAPGNGVDRLLASTIDQDRVFAAIGVQNYGFNAALLPKQLKQRGVDDPNLLPVYPYRDDARLVWDAIYQWVSDYLSLYYSTDDAVQQDTALQAWAAEAQAYDGGRVSDFGQAEGRIQTREYLIDAATLIIFTASAQHAAVNFPQKDVMSYAPAVPTAGYLPASILGGEIREQDYLNFLPPLEQAQQQLNLLHLLGSIYYNKLGQYPIDHFSDPQVQPLLQNFQNNLQQVETTIQQRNLHRPVYEYLLPSRIPQSINI